MPRRPVLIVSGRHPYQITVLLFCLAGGVSQLWWEAPPASLAATLPAIAQTLWNISLIAGGLLGLGAVMMRTYPQPFLLKIESAGVLFLASASSVYLIALFTFSGTRAVGAAMYVGAVAFASAIRAWQIRRDAKSLLRALKLQSTVAVQLLADPGARGDK